MLKKIKLNVRKVDVTLKQYTKFLILTSENREKIKKVICYEKLKIKFEMDGKLCPGFQPPSLKFSPSSFRESPPPPPFNPEIFLTPSLKFWLESQPPPPPLERERGGVHYGLFRCTKSILLIFETSSQAPSGKWAFLCFFSNT